MSGCYEPFHTGIAIAGDTALALLAVISVPNRRAARGAFREDITLTAPFRGYICTETSTTLIT